MISSVADALRAAAWTLLPPSGFVWSAAIGATVYWRWRKAGVVLLAGSLAGLAVLSLPIVSYGLLSLGEVSGERDVGTLAPAEAAIIVLGADVRREAREYGPITLGPLSLERLRYAARLQRRTGLPILTSGGRLEADDTALSVLMAEALATDFGVPVRWIEDRSRNTAENARFSAEILRKEGISVALVVTHAWHMRRAIMAFEKLGLDVRPTPTLAPHRPTGLDMIVPSAESLYESFLGIHELAGRIYYQVAHRAS